VPVVWRPRGPQWPDRPACQRWLCKFCKTRFDDLTGTVLAGHHQPLRIWVLCLMGLNLSNRQIAQELDLSEGDVQAMAEQLRQGLVERQPEARLDGDRRGLRGGGPQGQPGRRSKKPERQSSLAVEDAIAFWIGG
jgi:hypothetical protein